MSGLSYFDNGGQAEATTEAAPFVKPTKSKTGLPMVATDIPLDPGVLASMEQMYADRVARQQGFMEAMKDAAAWWSGGVEGPSMGLSRRAKERQEQEESLLGMQTQIAQYKAAQQQAAKAGTTLDQMFGGKPAAESGQVVSPQGIIVPPDVATRIARIRQTQGDTAALKAFNDWESTRLTEQSKGRYNPSTFRPEISVRIAGTDETELIDADIAGKLRDFGIAEPTWQQLDDVRAGRAPRKAAPAPAPAPAPATTGNLTAADKAIPPAPAPAPAAAPKNYTFDELSQEQLAMLKAKEKALGLQGDVTSRPDAAELFNRQPLDKRKAIFNSLQPEPAPAAPAPAPAPAAPAPAVRKGMPRIQAETKMEVETETQRIGEMKKKDVEQIDQAEKADEQATDTIVKMKRLNNLVSSAPEFYGLADKPGAGGALIGAAMTGVKIGQNGQIAMPGVEDFVRKVSPSLKRLYPDPKEYQQKLAEVKEVAGILHEVELKASQAYKGQGQVSDYERKIVAAIAGSTSDPARLLSLKARWYEMKAQNDKDLGNLMRTIRQEKGPMVAMYTIKSDPRYVAMKEQHRERASQFFPPEILAKANTIDLNNLPTEGPATATSTRQAPQPKFTPNTGLRDKYSRQG